MAEVILQFSDGARPDEGGANARFAHAKLNGEGSHFYVLRTAPRIDLSRALNVGVFSLTGRQGLQVNTR